MLEGPFILNTRWSRHGLKRKRGQAFARLITIHGLTPSSFPSSYIFFDPILFKEEKRPYCRCPFMADGHVLYSWARPRSSTG